MPNVLHLAVAAKNMNLLNAILHHETFDDKMLNAYDMWISFSYNYRSPYDWAMGKVYLRENGQIYGYSNEIESAIDIANRKEIMTLLEESGSFRSIRCVAEIARSRRYLLPECLHFIRLALKKPNMNIEHEKGICGDVLLLSLLLEKENMDIEEIEYVESYFTLFLSHPTSDVSTPDFAGDGTTMLQEVLQDSRFSLPFMKTVLEHHSCKINKVVTEYTTTALGIAYESSYDDQDKKKAVMDLIRKNGGVFDIKYAAGFGFDLAVAQFNGPKDALWVLKECLTYPNIASDLIDENKWTILHHCVYHGRLFWAPLGHGNVTNEGILARMDFLLNHHLTKQLINIKNCNGDTVLDLAFYKSQKCFSAYSYDK